MMQAVVRVGVAAAILGFCAAEAQAESFSLVTGNDYAPFTDQKLPEGGMLTEVTKAAFAAAGKEVTITFLPWKRGYDDTKTGTTNGTFPYLKTAEREGEMAFSEPMFVVRQRLYTNKDIAIADEAALTGKSVCVPGGYAQAPVVQKAIDEKRTTATPATDMPACMKLVAAGRVNFVQADEILAAATMKQLGLTDSDIKVSPINAGEAALHLLGGKTAATSAAMIAAFNEGLDKIKKDGSYDKIVAKHLK